MNVDYVSATNMAQTIPIEEGFSLKVRKLEDAEAFFEVVDRNRTYLREWLPWVDATKIAEDTRIYIQECLENIEKGTGYDLGMCFEDQWVGSIGLNSISATDRKADIGYWLDQKYEGKGLMAKAVQALVKHSFTEMNLNRLTIMAAVENTKSRAIAERLGFVQEGVCRQDEWLYDRFIDLAIYSLLRSDWEREGNLPEMS
jgi:ribosomal-protein-serine acetyltransferase